MEQLIKRHLIALFLDVSETETPEWVRIMKSEELTIAMNPEKADRYFIADEGKSTDVIGNKPTIEQGLVMYKGSPDYDFIWKKFYHRKYGAESQVKTLIVFMAEGDNTLGFDSWETTSTLEMVDLNAVDSKINFVINLGGTIENLKYKVVDKKPVKIESAGA